VHNGYLVQSRNGADALGYVFVDCTLTAAPNVERFVLARIEPVRFPHSQVAFINCAMGPHVSRVGWQLDKVPGAEAPGAAAQIRFWEFQSRDLSGQPLAVAGRLAGARQLLAAEAAELLRIDRVLGGWSPLVAEPSR
jgi:pectinesterase